MFPIGDNAPTRRFPIAVLLIIALNIWVFVQELKLGFKVDLFINQYALIPARDFITPMQASSFWHWISPYITSMFLHAGIWHILSNMWSLWIFGDNIEGEMGALRFVAFYISCGVVGAVAHCMINYGSAVPMLGASGAIAGVMGAFLRAFPRARLKMFTLLIIIPLFFQLPAFLFISLWFVIQLLSANPHDVAQAGVAFSVHVGGFVAGFFFYPMMRPKISRR